jgi:hypothetical protein
MAKREGMHQRKEALLQGQKQYGAVVSDFEKLNAVALAEQEPGTMQRWSQLKQEQSDYAEQLMLLERGLVAIDEEIESALAGVREMVEDEVNRQLVAPIRTVVSALQGIVGTNRRLGEIERTNSRLLQGGPLEICSPWLEGWLLRLERKLALIDPGR